MSRSENNSENNEAIAVIGMSGRFPKAPDLAQFWRNLCAGVTGISRFTAEELVAQGLSRKLVEHPSYVPASGAIEGIEEIDAAFFDFSPGEARLLDPHHRLFLEHSWQALENAGYDPRTYEGIIAVYGGMGTGEYAFGHLLADPETASQIGGLELRIYNDKDFLASLTAYKLDLRGPSASVQTACSTSLVTTCMACQSLLAYQCDLALSGGVAVASTGRAGYLSRAGVFSPDGHCRAFDAQAAGTVVGSGVGVLVLKRLDRALADGDTIHAVIRGWATNNDGALKVGYTAPSVDGQTEVIALAQAVAGVEAETITYVETHGTGTPLGDQIEIAALTEVFRQTTPKTGFCAVGSVKASIGHLDAAAGVASLIKTVLALEHRQLPPSLGFTTPNPQIDFAATPFYVQTELTPWVAAGSPLRAGVSAFAVGGVNAHLVLEEPPEPLPSGPGRSWQLLVLSARTPTALAAAEANLAGYLRSPQPAPLADVAHTLQIGRRAFEHRQVLVVGNRADALAVLDDPESARRLGGMVARGAGRRVVFLFPGLGNHYVGMARGLYLEEPVFRRHLDHCAELLAPRLGLDFRSLLYPENPAQEVGHAGAGPDLRRLVGRDAERESAAGELLATRLAQPVLFAVEHALARLWMSWGIEPAAMLGFSLGEYVAATLAGVLELEDALALVAERARLIDELPHGAMLAVPLAERELTELLGEGLSISAVNGPAVTVVGGVPAAVAALATRLAGRGVVSRRLETTHAFHTEMMAPAVEPLRRHLRGLRLRAPEIPFVSNLTGTWITAGQATDPDYWAQHLRYPVRFADGVEALWQDPGRILLEVGPGQTLSSWALQLAGEGRAAVASMRHAYDPQSDLAYLLAALGRLWLLGVRVDWRGFAAEQDRRRVPLPTYPFERKRFWVDRPRPGAERAGRAATAVPTGRNPDLGQWFFRPVWRQQALAPAAPAAPAAPPARADRPRRWLLLLDDQGLGLALAERLEAIGGEVVIAAAGRRFEKVEAGAYTLDPASPAGWIELLGDLRGTGFEPEQIVHLWTFTATAPTPERGLELGVLSLLGLVQALGDQRSAAVEITVVSSHLHQVSGQDEVHPEKAAVLGICAIAPLEVAGIRCRSLDIAPAPAGSPLARRLVERLVAELGAEAGHPTERVAYRGARRWVQDFVPMPLPPVASAPAGSDRLRPRGVYLITGGLGGVGLTLAETLARTLGARLVLVGRSGLPPAETWRSWLEQRPPGDPTSHLIRRLRRLEAAGGEVLALSADVTDAEAMRRVRARAIERFGAVDGIVHAAGLSPGGLTQIKTRDELLRVLAPKQLGPRVLQEVFADDPLDFLLLCSSLTALTGAVGLLDHTAANAVLDAHAQASAVTASWPVVAVSWDTWLEVGQAAAVAASVGIEMGRELDEQRHVGHPLLETCIEQTPDRTVYRTLLSRERHWFLDEHRLADLGLVPATAYLEAARAAWVDRCGEVPCELRQMVLLAPLLVPDGQERELRLTLSERGGELELRIDSRESPSGGGAWLRHAEGKLRRVHEPQPQPRSLAALRAACPERIAAGTVRARSATVSFGPRWQCFSGEICLGTDQALLALELPAAFSGDLAAYRLHPALLDAATGFVQSRFEGLYLPLGYEKVTLWRSLPASIVSSAKLCGDPHADAQTLVCDVTLLDKAGMPVVEISELTLRRVDPKAISAVVQPAGSERSAPAPGPESAQPSLGLRPSEGAEVFRRLLAAPQLPPQVVISTRDFPRLLEQLRERVETQPLETRARLHQRRGQHPRPSLATLFVAPRTGLEQQLGALWSDLLALEEVGVHDNFFDLGGDSLLATRMIALIEERLGVQPSLRSIFEAPTIVQQAQLIVELQAQEIDADALASALAEIEGLSA